jgi:acetyl-CoA carboxylase carboxyl transferase subunit alpha
MKLDAKELIKFGVADEIIEEPLGGTHRDPDKSANNLRDALLKHLQDLTGMDQDTLLEKRYQKYRSIGVFLESESYESSSSIG